eukprot:1290261-Ditylum_brightwellii.AAC.1
MDEDTGAILSIIIPTYLVTIVEIQLLSPQQYFKHTESINLALDKDKCLFTTNHSITPSVKYITNHLLMFIPHTSPRENVQVIFTQDKAPPVWSILDEENTSLTTHQNELLAWNLTLGHL